MATIDRYSGNHTAKFESGNKFVIDGNLEVTGNIQGSFGDTTIDGQLTVTNTINVATAGLASSGNFNITSGNLINLDANGEVNISGTDFFFNASDDFSMQADGGFLQLETVNTGAGQPNPVRIFGDINNGPSSPSTVLEVQNESTSENGDGIRILLGVTTPTENSVWARFSSQGFVSRGRIRGANTSTSVAFQADSSDGGGQVNAAGEVVYASGGSDFGEWVSVGDVYEWGMNKEELENALSSFYFGIPEGYVVYVRDKKFYKESPGTPMVVTHRALVVGNERDLSDPGQILSFIGQVPVYVSGKVSTGDFLIPNGSYCYAVNPDTIEFSDYIRSIGVAWESSDKEGLKRVMAAIGVKNK